MRAALAETVLGVAILTASCGGYDYNLSAPWTMAYAGASIDLTGYAQAFFDDFNSPSISAIWTAPSTPQYGAAMFQGPGSTYEVAGGMLTIHAALQNGKWTAGSIQSVNETFTTGYFEARMKLPSLPGSWPAFWMLPPDLSGMYVELDAMETYGNAPKYYHVTKHIWHLWKTAAHSSSGTAPPINTMDGTFHQFGLLIEDTFMAAYLDRVEIARHAILPEDKAPKRLIVSNALETVPVDSAPRDLVVDYVGVWKK